MYSGYGKLYERSHNIVRKTGVGSCGHSPENYVSDNARGTVVCTKCGSVLDEFSFQFWKTTFNDSKNYSNFNNFESFGIQNNSLNTVVNNKSLNRIHYRACKSRVDKRRDEIIEKIESISRILRLHETIISTAKQVYTDLENVDGACKRGRKSLLVAAASISIASRLCNFRISYKELSDVIPELKSKEIMKTCNYYGRKVSIRKPYISPAKNLPRYLPLFGLDFKHLKLSEMLLRFIYENNVIPGMNPTSCISLALYLAMNLLQTKINKTILDRNKIINEISSKANIAVNTIKKCIIKFEPYFNKFLNKENYTLSVTFKIDIDDKNMKSIFII